MGRYLDVCVAEHVLPEEDQHGFFMGRKTYLQEGGSYFMDTKEKCTVQSTALALLKTTPHIFAEVLKAMPLEMETFIVEHEIDPMQLVCHLVAQGRIGTTIPAPRK